MDDTRWVADIQKILHEVLAGGLKQLPPKALANLSQLLTRHGCRLRFIVDGGLVTCQIVFPDKPEPREPADLFYYTDPVPLPAVSAMVN